MAVRIFMPSPIGGSATCVVTVHQVSRASSSSRNHGGLCASPARVSDLATRLARLAQIALATFAAFVAFTAVAEVGAEAATTSTAATAGDDGWGDTGGDGWGDAGSFDFGNMPVPTESVAPAASSNVRAGGYLRTDNALWLERLDGNPWAKSRLSLDLDLRYAAKMVRVVLAGHLEYDLAYLHDRDAYDQPTLDAYEWDVQGRETFIGVELGPLDLSLGRQIVAWGQGEVVSPLDIVNPRDNREPGLADLEDIRMPVLMTRAGLFLGRNRFELMIIHEADFGRRSSPLGPFSPLNALLQSPDAQMSGLTELLRTKTVRFENHPGRFVSNEQQVLFRWQYTGEGVDLALYAASILDQEGVVALPDLAVVADPSVSRVNFPVSHPRYTMLGESGAAVSGAFLLEWELAFALGRSLNVGDLDADPPIIGVEEHNLLQMMLGLTYSGVEDLSLTLEWGKSIVVDGAPRLRGSFAGVGSVQAGRLSDFTQAAEEPIFAFRALYTTLSQRLQLSGAVTWFGWIADFGWLVLGEALYQIVDPVSVSLGFITYQPGSKNSPLEGLDKHDRIFLKARWDFSIF